MTIGHQLLGNRTNVLKGEGYGLDLAPEHCSQQSGGGSAVGSTDASRTGSGEHAINGRWGLEELTQW